MFALWPLNSFSAIVPAMTDKAKDHEAELADFGFNKIPAAEKAGRVRAVFDQTAEKYDIMNDVLSAGLHRLWKAHLIARLPLHHDGRPIAMLDVAGGTGDIAFKALETKAGRSGCLSISLLDINEEMLAVGRRNAQSRGYKSQLDFIAGDAEKLPFADASMDIYTISFGIRNVTHRDRALAEAHRVLKPGGIFACLEFSQLPNKLLQRAYDAYSFNIVPKLGQFISNNAASYEYLVESIRMFPRAEDFASEIQEAGFARVRYEHLSAGITATHFGWRK
jgi:demethylmenaquinone methyltransferase/2-methoxy-6-polyprenyl-1,4-benzoquinol methylase